MGTVASRGSWLLPGGGEEGSCLSFFPSQPPCTHSGGLCDIGRRRAGLVAGLCYGEQMSPFPLWAPSLLGTLLPGPGPGPRL